MKLGNAAGTFRKAVKILLTNVKIAEFLPYYAAKTEVCDANMVTLPQTRTPAHACTPLSCNARPCTSTHTSQHSPPATGRHGLRDCDSGGELRIFLTHRQSPSPVLFITSSPHHLISSPQTILAYITTPLWLHLIINTFIFGEVPTWIEKKAAGNREFVQVSCTSIKVNL